MLPIFQPSHMPNNRKEEKYISLLEAARIYGCTQKHMALMAREKKLRAIKLGRNWLTTIDWLKEYNKAREENNKKRQIKKAPVKKVIFTPQVKSVFKKTIAVSLISLLVFAFISTAYVAAKEKGLSLDPIKQLVSKIITLDFQSSNLASIRAFSFARPLYKKHLASVFDEIKILDKKVNQKVNQWVWEPLKPITFPVYSKVIKPVVDEVSYDAKTIIRGYNKTKHDAFAFIDNLFTKTGNFVINSISNTGRVIVKAPSSFGRFVNNVFQDLPRSLKKFFTFEPFILGFPASDTSEQSYIAIKDIYKKLSDIRKEVGEKEIIITETVQKIVQEITVVKPVEIRKEIEVIKDQAVLDELKISILAEVDAKISAIEITEFESMTFHYDSLWANIGSFSTALGTGGFFSAVGPVTLGDGSEKVVINATNWDVDDSGNITTGGDISLASLTASGDITASGNITGSGTLAIAGQATFTGAPSGTTVSDGSVYINPSTASSSYTLFGVAVNGTEKLRLNAEGDLIIAGSLTAASTSFDAIDATTLSLDKIPTIISDPVLLMQPTNVSGSWATGSATFLGINASSSFSGNFADFRINNTSKFFIDEAGNLGAAGVGQFGGIATLSYSRFGIATTSYSLVDSDDLLISGMLEVDEESWFDSLVNFQTIASASLFYAKDGSVASPSYTFSLDPNTGIFREGDDSLSFTTGGTRRINIGSDGALTIDAVASHSAEGDWAFDTDTFYINSGTNRVGIGITAPSALLDVGGGTINHIDGTNDILIADSLEVDGQAWFDSNASVSGKFEVLGSTTLGDTTSDLLVVNAYVASDVIPNDNTRDIGTTDNRWAHGYFDLITVATISATATDVGGTTADAFVINSDNTSDDTEDSYLTFERGAPTTNASIKWDSTNTRFDLNFPLTVQGYIYGQDEIIIANQAQFGGTSTESYSRFGTGTTNYGLSASNDLLITGNLEVDSSVWFDSNVSVSGNAYLQGTTYLGLTTTYFDTSGNLVCTDCVGDSDVSDTLTASIFKGSGTTTDAVDLATAEVAGTLTVNKGGTGATTFTANGVLYGNTQSAIQALAVNATATNKFLTQVSSGAPAWNTIVAGDLPGSFSGFANPTATIGLTVINGSATTAMRSDAAPPLSQAIIPTWTGTHTFSNGTYSALFTGGSVGIGTTTPAMKLDVQGGALLGGEIYVSPTNVNTLNSGYTSAADDADIWINYRGYNDAQAYFRDFRVGDGKGTQIALFDGSTQGLTVAGTVTAPTFVAGEATLSNRLYMNSGTNLHIDSNAAGITYINYYGGTGGVNFCNGANVCSANVSAAGAYTGINLNTGQGAQELYGILKDLLSGSAITITGGGDNVLYGPDGDISIAVGTDLITDTHLFYNTGQHLTTSSTPQFARLGLGAAADGTYLLNLNGALVHGTSTGVGIGTTTPGAKLDIYSTGNTTSLQVLDSGGNQVLILDESSSPDIWEQALSYQFEQGTLYQVTIDKEKDHLLLSKDINGNYYSNGTFTSSIHNYSELGGIGEFIKFVVNSQLLTSTKINARVEVSDDNFLTIKGSVNLELTGGVQKFDISSLPNAQYVRVKLDFQTENTSVTPRLIFFEVWADVIEVEADQTQIATQNNAELTQNQDAEISTDTSISDTIYIDSLGNVGIGGTASISGDLYVGGVLYASVGDLGFANDFIITEATDEPALSFLNLEQEEIMRINDQGTLKIKELCLGETCINEEDLKSFVGLKIASSSGTVEDNITITYSTNPIEFLGDLINGLKELGVSIKDGVIEAVKLVVDEVKTKILRANTISITVEPDQDNVVGSAIIPRDSMEYQVENSLVEENSKIFISFTSNTAGRTWYVSEKTPGVGFTIRLSEVTTKPLDFDYWIVLVEGVETTNDTDYGNIDDNDIVVPEPQPLQPSSEGEGQAEPVIEEEPIVEEPIVEEEPQPEPQPEPEPTVEEQPVEEPQPEPEPEPEPIIEEPSLEPAPEPEPPTEETTI